MSEQGKQINLQNLYETVRHEDLIKELQKDPQMALRVLLQAAINRRD
jgi:hypothetical protein